MASAISPTEGREPCDGCTTRAPSDSSARASPAASATATMAMGAPGGPRARPRAPDRADHGTDRCGRFAWATVAAPGPAAGGLDGASPSAAGESVAWCATWSSRSRTATSDSRPNAQTGGDGQVRPLPVDVDAGQALVAGDDHEIAHGRDGPSQLPDVDAPFGEASRYSVS